MTEITPATKFLITKQQVDRIAMFDLPLAQEIARATFYQQVEDSTALATHLDNLAEHLIAQDVDTYQLPIRGGFFVWVPPKKVAQLAEKKATD